MSTSPIHLAVLCGASLRIIFRAYAGPAHMQSKATVMHSSCCCVSLPHNDGLRLAIWILVISVLRRCWISFSILKRSGTVSLQRECALPRFTPSFGTVLPSIQTIWSYVSAFGSAFQASAFPSCRIPRIR